MGERDIFVHASAEATTSRFYPSGDRPSVLSQASLSRSQRLPSRYLWLEGSSEAGKEREPELLTTPTITTIADYSRRSALLRRDTNVASLDLGKIFSQWRTGREAALILTPHDDDPPIGMGLTLEKLAEAGVPMRVVVVTDGRNGYTQKEHKPTIVADRKAETERAFANYGLKPEDIVWLGFPDTALTFYQGRRAPLPGESCPVSPSGFTGLEDALVTELRRPFNLPLSGMPTTATRVFTVNGRDLHQDHVTLVNAIRISLFHAMGGIWPENGATPKHLPYLYEFPVYCAFDPAEPPNIMLVGHEAAFQTKLTAIGDFASQTQIGELVASVRENGPFEFLREVAFQLFDPKRELARFA